MPVERFPPDDPREWLNRAKSNLAKARSASENPEIYLEDLCFDAQQAAEKAIKAVLLSMNVRFPYSHDLAQPCSESEAEPILTLVDRSGLTVPNNVKQAAVYQIMQYNYAIPDFQNRLYIVNTRMPTLPQKRLFAGRKM